MVSVVARFYGRRVEASLKIMRLWLWRIAREVYARR
jgi:hypothetical protein